MIQPPRFAGVRVVAFASTATIACLAACVGCSGVQDPSKSATDGEPDAPGELLARFEPSPPEVVAAMLEAAKVTSKDTVFDLGSGDGRVVIEAARKYQARGVGIERDESLVRLAEARSREAGVEARATFRRGDLLTEDISAATVVTIFLSQRGNAKLEDRLKTHLRPGTRIVSHCHTFAGWSPQTTVRVTVDGREHTVYVWTVQNAETAPDLGPFVPTPMPIVRLMLEMAGVKEGDVVFDLGCGDGRIVIEAAKSHGARGVGIEYDGRLCQLARESADREGVADLVEIRHEDVTKSDFSEATVVALYLLPISNEILRPRIQALRPGTRVVAHDFKIGDWKPLETRELWLRDNTEQHFVRLWRVGE